MLPAALDRTRTALIFIEFQAEWLDQGGVLFQRLVQDQEAFREAVSRAGEVILAARRSRWTIVQAGLDLRDDPSYRLFAGGQSVIGLRAAIPRAGTWTGEGAAFVPPFVPAAGEFIVKGRSGASVLNNSNLDAFLRNNRIDTLVLMGFATHVCVESTLRDAHDRGFNVHVAIDGCAAFTRAQDSYFREHILPHFGAGIDAASLVKQLAV